MPFRSRYPIKRGTRRYVSRGGTSRTFSKGTSRGTRRTRYSRKRYTKVSPLRTKWPNPIRQTQLVKFRYEDTNFPIQTLALNGYIDYHIFRLNGPYDPDQTGVGVQPYGYDQMTPALFSRYQVYGSKCTVHFYIIEPDTIQKLRVFLVPYTGTGLVSSASNDPADIMQIPGSKRLDYNSADGSQGRSITNYCTMNKLFPYMKGANQNQFDSAYNSLPNIQGYWYVIFDTSAIEVEQVIGFDIRITYYTRLTRDNVTDES